MKKPRTRKEMIAYLAGHFRYDTMSSWNQSSSYAVEIKVRSLNLTQEQQGAVYEMLDVQDAWDESGYNSILRDFDRRNNYIYQIGTNGRSGGYLVLYQGGSKPSEHKSQCRACGQRNYQALTEEPGQCGKCNRQTRYNRDFPPDVFTRPGLSLDMNEDFEDKSEWSTQALRNRVDTVWDFDQTCARAVRVYVDYAMENKVVEKTIRVPKKIRVAEPRVSQ